MRQILTVALLLMLYSVWWSHVEFAWAGELDDFRATKNFLKLPDRWTVGACSAVAVSGNGEIYLFHRGQHPILCFDRHVVCR